MSTHISVLMEELISKLDVKPDGLYIDATLGRAGHSSRILEQLKSGKLYCFDKDLNSIKESKTKLEKINNNFQIIHNDFKNIDQVEEYEKEKFDGIIFDLGVSSPQLDEAQRGFSIHKDGPLDMRMDTTQSLTAKQVVNEYSQKDLTRIFREYGEDRYAHGVASKIIECRENKVIETTLELVEIIKLAKPNSVKDKKHPAKQIFQAIRIEVNGELEAIEQAIQKAFKLIKIQGKIIVITFHSLEDKIIKNAFYKAKQIKTETLFETKYKFRTSKSVFPSKEEKEENRRSRSAKLRIITRNY